MPSKGFFLSLAVGSCLLWLDQSLALSTNLVLQSLSLSQNRIQHVFQWRKPELKLRSISWRNCGAASDPFKLKKLDLKPSTLHFPEDLYLSYAISLATDVDSPINVNVHMKRKLGPVWITLPCEGEFGSCDYDDLCTLMQRMHIDLPPSLKCPFKKGEYAGEALLLKLPKVNLPEWLLSGNYYLKITASGANGQSQYACIEVFVKIV